MSNVKGPTGKETKETAAPKPDFLHTQAQGPGVGQGGDKQSSDKPVPSPYKSA